MKAFHLSLGFLVIVVFILTGQYMDRFLAHLAFTPDLPRMLYRSRHIYILLAGLVNLGIGSYVRLSTDRVLRGVQLLGSLLIVIATVLFVVAFFYEPPRGSFYVPFSRRAIYLIAVGTILHAVQALRRNERKTDRVATEPDRSVAT